ncbi:ATP-binding cassette domain-containing protein [Desulfoscipio gibsoniae]
MRNYVPLENLTIKNLLDTYPYSKEFFDINGLPIDSLSNTVKNYISSLPYVFLEDMGVNREGLLQRFLAFMERMEDIRKERSFSIHDITILGGRDKNGKTEEIELKINMGEILCIVGPTGSGKSRLLADIEWMAQRDTPTKRQILIDGSVPPGNWRFSIEHKLVAQLSQNMNFVMDISVKDFIKLHAQSRMIDNIENKTREIIDHANDLSGEVFDLYTPLTSLSGGQSRALMVADTAFLSTSPIVLIDEIENAGISRKKALELLVGQNKIVLIATHDPLLALMGNKRIVIKNGGIRNVIGTTSNEKKCLIRLTEIDNVLLRYREMLRNGEMLEDTEYEFPISS